MTRRKDGRGKKTKDRNAPRPPNTSYTIYFKQAFREYAEAHPGEDRKRITAVVAERWRGLTADEKKPFEDSAAKEREQYEKDLAVYKKTDSYKEFVGKAKEADRVSRKEKHHQ
ncbi:High mobility group, partial [Aphelenchoides avenae]